MKVKYPDCELLYTDTDSLIYNIKTDDLYQDIYDNKIKFDLSNSDIKKFKDCENEKTILKFKDETKFIPIIHFIALCPKSYSYITDKEIKSGKKMKSQFRKGKGVVKNILEQEVTHKDYEKILKDNIDVYKPQIMIRSRRHQLYTISMNKKTLCSYDDKLYRTGPNTAVPYGHYSLNQEK